MDLQPFKDRISLAEMKRMAPVIVGWCITLLQANSTSISPTQREKITDIVLEYLKMYLIDTGRIFYTTLEAAHPTSPFGAVVRAAQIDPGKVSFKFNLGLLVEVAKDEDTSHGTITKGAVNERGEFTSFKRKIYPKRSRTTKAP